MAQKYSLYAIVTIVGGLYQDTVRCGVQINLTAVHFAMLSAVRFILHHLQNTLLLFSYWDSSPSFFQQYSI